MKGKELEVMAVEVPSFLRCPISLELMKDPVTLCTGLTYDRRSIETWLDSGNTTCPVTNQVVQNLDLIPNHTLRRLIQDWCVTNRSKGIQRIPTPKVPLSPRQVTKILSEISAGDRESIRKLRALAKESDRNKKCIASSNAAFVLGSLFADNSPHAMNRVQNSVEMCEEALGMTAMMLPMNEQALEMFASSNAVACLVWILQQGNPEAKNSAVALLQEIVSKNKLYRERMGNVDGLAEGLVQLLREPICPAATKASITTIYHISLKRSFRVNAVEAGAVPLLLEILVGADGVICERALLALDILCSCTQGRAAAYEHALAVPVVVKKILRVSDLASEVAVSVLWNLCHNSSDGGAAIEAVQVGAFQKVLVVVQVRCGERTREKATMLLKLFNGYRADCECRESMSFSNSEELEEVQESQR